MQFSDILTRWMTEQGIITVTLPDQTTQQLRTTKEMDKQLDGKLDKTGGTITRNGAALTLKNIADGSNHYLQFQNADGKRRAFVGFGSDTNKNFSIVNDDVGGNITIREGGATINGIEILKLGDYGLGGIAVQITQGADLQEFFKTTNTGFYRGGASEINKPAGVSYADYVYIKHGAQGKLICYGNTNITYEKYFDGTSWSNWATSYSTANTTKDTNGNLKAASPIIRVFADHVDPNEEAEGVTLKKLHTGIYQLHGVLGLHSDASWGGINGGITIPCGINQLPLVYALYDVLEKGKPHPFDGRIVEPDEDGDIVLYTSYRQHDLPQNIQYERFKLYPEFLRDATEGEESIPGFDGKVELTPGEPCDIPRGHWVDVRVNMPSNSIYNQKQAEAERLAKLEAERLAQEEAKRAVEEVERVEQEAVERKQYGLDDNSVLL
ncbi:phage tail fiber protein [Providencia sp. PROV113]|uniref:phage tail fiber protein n=1 Tax=Providencia sp. PROV113 TaxID=2949824 RepID=UPI00234B8D4D|nr:hypothetical protein [Providencia sp. PROV113]